MKRLIIVLQLVLITSCNKSFMYKDTVLYKTQSIQKQSKDKRTKDVKKENNNVNSSVGDVNKDVNDNASDDMAKLFSSQEKKQKKTNNNVNMVLDQSSKENATKKVKKTGSSQDLNEYDDILNKALNKGTKQSALSIQQNYRSEYKDFLTDTPDEQFNQKKQQKKHIVGANMLNEQKSNLSDEKLYRIQCGNFKSKQMADELAGKLRSNGFKDVIVIQKNGGNVVLVGNFKSKDDGKMTMNKLKQSSVVENCFFVF